MPKSPNSPLDELNSRQKQAVISTAGPLLILAGAGAGKTKTVAERIRHLVSVGVVPSAILAITFTNKAAREMRERVKNALDSVEQPFVSTFHSLGVHILREQASHVGIKKFFTIFDRDDSRRAVKEALTDLGLDPKIHDPAQIVGIISKEKGMGVGTEDYLARGGRGYLSKVVAKVWPRYEKILLRDNALDFDDLLVKTRNLLSKNLPVRKYYQNLWEYIHVDEYQDTNRVQYEITRLLVGESMNICVVGDIDQNIYTWRGADIKNILDFEKDFPDAKIITLEENYRSSKTILEAANAVIEKNKFRRKKNLFTTNAEGEKISLFGARDESSEAEFIANKTADFIKQGSLPSEIAVLFRANFQSRILEEAFVRQSIPYQLLGIHFFERKEVKDIIAYLRLALNPENILDKKRVMNVPSRGIGKTTIQKIFSGDLPSLPESMKKKIENFQKLLESIEKVSKEKVPSETIAFIIKETGLEEVWKNGGDEGLTRLENAYELSNFASRYNLEPPEIGISNFLSDVALQSDQDELDENEGGVRLMTVHASKGLEFDIVFIAGLEEGLFPHQRALDESTSPEEREEERRLFYVALTRARKRVCLSYAETRTIFGRRQVGIPSGFIFDIPESLLETEMFDPYNLSGKSLLDIEF